MKKSKSKNKNKNKNDKKLFSTYQLRDGPVSPRDKRRLGVAKSFRNAKEYITSSEPKHAHTPLIETNRNRLKLKKNSSRSRSITQLSASPRNGTSKKPCDVYSRIAANLFDAMDLDDNTQQTLFHLINKCSSYKELDDKNLCSSRSLLCLKMIEQELSNLNIDQKKQKSALLIQCAFRSYCEQKKLKNGLQEFKKTKIQSYHDLCEKEKDFVMNLATLVSQYIVPLRQTNDKHLKKVAYDLDNLFKDLEKIMEVHQTLLKTLYELPRKSWPHLNGLGNVFSYISPHWKIYGTYVHNYKFANTTITDVLTKNEHFRIFLESGPRNLSSDLTMLLSLPLNHISGYSEYLKSILEYTPSDLPEHNSLLQAISITGETANFIRNSLAHAENLSIIHNLKRNIIETTESEQVFNELCDSNSSFVREIPVEFSISSKKKPVQGNLVIFDTICYSYFSTNKGGSMHNIYHLENTCIEKLPNSTGFSLFIVDEELSEYNTILEETRQIFNISSIEEVNFAVLTIQNLISHNQRNRTFGIPIDVLIERDKQKDGIPIVLKIIVNNLCENGLDTVGLFRIPGKATNIKRAKTIFNQCNGNYDEMESLDFLKSNDTAGLLKMFFHDLPEPLIPHTLYSSFISIFPADKKNLVVLLGELKELLDKIPEPIFNILRYVIKFLVSVALVEENKMGPSNLATCFGPNILRPVQQTIESSLAIPKSNNCVEYFIQYFDILFDATKVKKRNF